MPTLQQEPGLQQNDRASSSQIIARAGALRHAAGTRVGALDPARKPASIVLNTLARGRDVASDGLSRRRSRRWQERCRTYMKETRAFWGVIRRP